MAFVLISKIDLFISSLNMALQLRTKPQLESFFTSTGLSIEISKEYAKIFTENRMTELILPNMCKEYLHDL